MVGDSPRPHWFDAPQWARFAVMPLPSGTASHKGKLGLRARQRRVP